MWIINEIALRKIPLSDMFVQLPLICWMHSRSYLKMKCKIHCLFYLKFLNFSASHWLQTFQNAFWQPRKSGNVFSKGDRNLSQLNLRVKSSGKNIQTLSSKVIVNVSIHFGKLTTDTLQYTPYTIPSKLIVLCWIAACSRRKKSKLLA